jgi:ribosomal protein S18 acetylase RimI-like enzyme
MTKIRRATPDDIDALYELGKGVSEFAVSSETVGFWPKSILQHAVHAQDMSIAVAQDDGLIVGFVIASYSEGLRKATIENIFVSAKYRGRHIGDMLLAWVIDDVVTMGCEYIAALVPQDASPALGLYGNAGFARGETFVWLDKTMSKRFELP